MRQNVYSVGQVNTYIKNMFGQDYLLNRLYVKGEVSNCKYHTSGHIYFSLKDETGAIACVMFAAQRSTLKFRLAEGQTVSGKTFAGKGTDIEIRERYRLEVAYKKPADSFEKVSGKGYIIVDGKKRYAELHWYESENEVFEMKVKRFLDES